ncbi:MAG: Alginate biosynthesis protein AlgA [Candidatus Omnitrophica bacterium]|nr:Alginate biosynthesis protein AlgA [Candidatus Omnitrophota bacterium]
MEESLRPWGRYARLFMGEDFQVKRIEVNPGAQFSLQKHLKRAERWIVTSGKGRAVVGDRVIEVQRGSYVEIELGQVHRMTNSGEEPLVFIEVQFGSYLGEDDIVRLQDDFGRA